MSATPPEVEPAVTSPREDMCSEESPVLLVSSGNETDTPPWSKRPVTSWILTFRYTDSPTSILESESDQLQLVAGFRSTLAASVAYDCERTDDGGVVGLVLLIHLRVVIGDQPEVVRSNVVLRKGVLGGLAVVPVRIETPDAVGIEEVTT